MRTAPRPSLSSHHARRSLLVWALSCAPLCAQQFDYKPAPVPDPVKGMHDMSPLTPAELAMRCRRTPYATDVKGEQVLRDTRGTLPEEVCFDQPGDGRIWAHGVTYKASFGPEGFVYVPFLGASAPKNYPVHFVLRSVRIGGTAVAFTTGVSASQAGTRVTFDRGAVRETYDLATRQVEQTFLVDSSAPGDVEVDLEVVSELTEDPGLAGLQFGNALGQVHYGTAYVVDAAGKREITSTFGDGRIRMHVPAASRGAGPVVIDPIIHTSAFTQVTTRECHNPDIAYDATYDRYMVVWELVFSATDTDVFSEFRRGDGSALGGSLASIDSTTLNHAHPRIANINSNNLFLVVMQRLQGAQWQIWGRRRLANSTPQPELFPISDPALLGHCVFPDVGGDPDESGPERQWLVVWERQLSAADFDIHGRIVRADTSQPPTIFIENSANTIYSLPAVSQSNGNGFTLTPRWLVAYQFRSSPTDEDIYGAVLDRNGAITRASSAIDRSPFHDLVPSVSSPVTDLPGGDPLFMVTYERQSPADGRALVLNLNFINQITPTGLGQFGLGPFWVRAESDGCRFAVIAGNPIGPITLALANGTLVRHDPPAPLPGVPLYARIASKRSGGGVHTDYGIAYVDDAPAPNPIMVAAYRGHAGGSDITRRTMACGGLGIDVTGRAFLGEKLQFTLTNVGASVPGYLLGVPLPALPVCPGCSLGVDAAGPLFLFVNSSQLPLTLPCDTSLAGAGLAVQGFGIGAGTCLGSLRFSDTIDFTVR